MAKVLRIITVLIIAFSILQEATNNTTLLPTQVTGYTSTETHRPSNPTPDYLSTASTVSSASDETHLTNSTSPETSTHPAATSSPSHTLSNGENMTTDQTKTTLMDSNHSGTTALRTTKLTSVTNILSSTEGSAETAATKGKVDTTLSSGSSNNGNDSLATNPGLVAILCIFFIVLALVIAVAIAKLISSRKSSQFERLDDLPMNKINEDAPFAKYPPK